MYSSHILCKVDDLHAAVGAWTAAGFTVQLGDRPEKAANALIWFEDGPFIELIDPKVARPPALFSLAMKKILRAEWVHRFDRWANQADGWCELALETTGSVKPELARIKAAGIGAFGPVTNKRKPVDSELIKTQTAFPNDLDLPILMGAYHPDPRPQTVQHSNGATGVREIQVQVPASARPFWDVLLDEREEWLSISTGPRYKVQWVVLNGLSVALSAEQLNHAVFTQPC